MVKRAAAFEIEREPRFPQTGRRVDDAVQRVADGDRDRWCSLALERASECTLRALDVDAGEEDPDRAVDRCQVVGDAGSEARWRSGSVLA